MWSEESSFTLFPSSGGVCIWRIPKEAYSVWFQQWKTGGSVMVWATMSWLSVHPIITLQGQITAREYMDWLGNQGHPMVQALFLSNIAVLQDDTAPIHTAGTVQSWFEEHEGELQHFP
jgi:hypothetical protein